MTIQHARDAAMEAAHFLEALPILDGLEVMVGDRPSDDGAVLEIAWKGGSFEARFNADLTVTSDVEVFGPWAEQFDPWRAWTLTVAQFLAIGTNPATRQPFGPHAAADITVSPFMDRRKKFFGPVTDWKVLMKDPAGPLVIGAPFLFPDSAVDAMSEDDPRASMLEGHSIRWTLRIRVYDHDRGSWGWSTSTITAEADAAWNDYADEIGICRESLTDDIIGVADWGRLVVEEVSEVSVIEIGRRPKDHYEEPTLIADLGFADTKDPRSDRLISRMVSPVVPYRNRDVRFVIEVSHDDSCIDIDFDGFDTMPIRSARLGRSSYMAFLSGRDAFAMTWADDPDAAPATFEGVADVTAEWVDRKVFGRRYANNDIYRASVTIRAERQCDMGHWHEDDDAFYSTYVGGYVDGAAAFGLARFVADAIEDSLDGSVMATLRNR